MRKMITAAAIMLGIFVLAAPSVMAGEGRSIFNFYQWLRDDDGDGIPNCLDPDYVRPEDGTGYGKLGPGDDTLVLGDKDQIRDRDRLRDGSCGTDECKLYKYDYKYYYNNNYNYKWGGTKK